MTLQARAMLANLNIRMWSGRKYDNTVTAEIDQTKGAKDAGRYNKQLIDKSYFAVLQGHVGAMRRYHYEQTLPWGDNGDRLLPSTQYFEYMQAMHPMRDEFQKSVDTFIAHYTNVVQGERQRLGQMYNPDDYPLQQDLARRFSVDVTMMPVPDVSDFRCEVSKEDRDEITEKMQKVIADRAHKANYEIWSRLRVVVLAMERKLFDPTAIFRDSLVDNLHDLAILAPKLNIDASDELINVCNTIRRTLCVNPETLRKDVAVRANTANLCGVILKTISAAMAALVASQTDPTNLLVPYLQPN